jgi:hypothetical protein
MESLTYPSDDSKRPTWLDRHSDPRHHTWRRIHHAISTRLRSYRHPNKRSGGVAGHQHTLPLAQFNDAYIFILYEGPVCRRRRRHNPARRFRLRELRRLQVAPSVSGIHHRDAHVVVSTASLRYLKSFGIDIVVAEALLLPTRPIASTNASECQLRCSPSLLLSALQLWLAHLVRIHSHCLLAILLNTLFHS